MYQKFNGENWLQELAVTFYALESVFFKLIDSGMLIPIRDEHGNFQGFSPNTGKDCENLPVRKLIAIKSFMAYREGYVNWLADQYLAYVWFASMGEARHAHDEQSKRYPVCIPQGCSRDASARNAKQYNPLNDHNRKILSDLYHNGSWSGAYGGKNWGNIVDSIRLYHLNKVAFIDLVHDLEHNNGTVFSKPSAANMLNLHLYDTDLNSLLDYKKSYDITGVGSVYTGQILQDALSAINGVNYILGLARIRPYYDTRASESYESYSPFTWGEKELDDDGYTSGESELIHCDKCGDAIDSDDACSLNWDTFCQSCYDDITFYCNECEEHKHTDNMSIINDVCDDCYSSNYSECEKCNSVYPNDELEWVHTPDNDEDCVSLICEDCKDTIVMCDNCDTEMWEDDTYTVTHSDKTLCYDCARTMEAQGYNELQVTFFELV